MPTYAAAGLIGGVIALGFLIWTIWTHESPQIVGNNRYHRNEFEPEPGYDRPRDSSWGTGNEKNRRRRKVIRDEEDNCPICQEPIESNNRKVLPCTHKFHGSCVTKWFNERRTCPTCRKPV